MNAPIEHPHLELKEGEKLAFSITLPDGKTTHTILLPGDNDDASWEKQMEWAKSIGGDLPDRSEQALFFQYMPDEFQKDWYWSNKQREAGAAWGQYVSSGSQHWYGRSDQCRARAVRRVAI
jgi:hypothetical protein